MELRKLQKTGGSTFVVSLPKKWVERENLNRGSVITLEEQKDGSLMLSPRTITEKQVKESEIFTKENLERKLIEKYLLGYDILQIKPELKFKEHEKKEIKKILQTLVGFEIIEETANSIVVKNIVDPTEVSIMKSLRRMYTIVSVMHKDLITAFETKDRSLLKDVIQRDEEVDKLYFLLVRQIRTVIQNPHLQDNESIKAVDCVDYRFVVKIIEQIGDCLCRIAREMLKQKSLKKFSALRNTVKDTFEIHNKAAQAIFRKDEKLADEAKKLRQKFTIDKITIKDLTLLNILNNFARIADIGKDLADFAVSE